MPTYDYKCTKCGHTEALKQPLEWAPAISFCVICNDSTMQKKLNRPSLHFKGSGFYETDYKNK